MPESILVHTPSQISIQVPDFLVDWADQFLKAKKIENVSVCTLAFYKQQLRLFLCFCEGQLLERISQITPTIIRDYLLWLDETGHNPGGRHAAYRVLKTFLRWYEYEAEPDGWRNPVNKVKAPRLVEEPLDPVEIRTVNAMTAVCDKSFLGRRDEAILLFLLDTGLRARELLSLNIDDVNFVTGKILLLSGKGRKPRDVFISRKTRRATRAYLKLRRDSLLCLFVLEGQTERLGYGGLRKMIIKRANKAKVKIPTAHEFRRAFALAMLRNGCDLVTLSRLMGHTSIKILSRYLKEVTDDLQEAHRRGSPVDRGRV